MTVVIGSDHAGHHYKEAIAEHLNHQGHLCQLVGSHATTDSYDYPNASDEVAQAISQNQAQFGILICGSGIGVSIRANRHSHIRAALCTSEELAKLAREHNHANVLCLGERIISLELAFKIVDRFLATSPDEGERHQRRVDLLGTKIEC